jgi:hypothetical protein
MRADGGGFAAVGARHGIELPDPDAPRLFERTWLPAQMPVDRHGPNCRSRCCGSWTLPAVMVAAAAVSPLARPAGQAPACSVPVPSAVPVVPVATPPAAAGRAPRPRRRRPAHPALVCPVCGVPVAAEYVRRTGRLEHGPCLPPAPAVGYLLAVLLASQISKSPAGTEATT